MKRLYLLLLAIALAACSDQHDQLQISGADLAAFEPDVAVTADAVAVVWNDNRSGADELVLRLLDTKLQAISAELPLTDSPAAAYEADAVWLHNDIAVAWYDRDSNAHLQVQLGLWTRSGQRLWQKTLSPPERQGRIPVLLAEADSLFVAWADEPAKNADSTAPPPQIYTARLDALGNYLQAPQLLAPASKTTWHLNAAAGADGRIALVYDAAHETKASEIYLTMIGSNSAVTQRLSADDGFASKYPDIALHDDKAALTWFDAKDGNEEVYLALLDLSQATVSTLDTVATRITQTTGESIGAYLAWNGDTLGLAWNDNSAGQHEIFFQSFDRNAQPLSPPRQLTKTAADSLIPSIKALGTGFILGWNEAVLAKGGHDGTTGTTTSDIVVQYVQ